MKYKLLEVLLPYEPFWLVRLLSYESVQCKGRVQSWYWALGTLAVQLFLYPQENHMQLIF